MAKAVDNDGRIWVAVHSVKAVQVFIPTSETWQTVTTSPLAAVHGSKLSVLGDGQILINGAAREGSYFPSSMAVINPDEGSATVRDARALQYVLRPDGSVGYVDGDTGEIRVSSPKDGSDAGTGVQLEGVSPLLSMATDAEGSIWLWRYTYRQVEVVRIDVEKGETSTFLYPNDNDDIWKRQGRAIWPVS